SVAAIVDAHDAHPFASRRGLFPGPGSAAGVDRWGSDGLTGIRRRGALARSLIAARRPDLALVVFTEVHEAGHMLWHTAEPSSTVYGDLGSPGAPPVGGIDALLREVDVEIGRLVDAAGPGAAVVGFARGGGRPTAGGRERDGRVAGGEQDGVRGGLAGELVGSRTAEGRPLVSRAVRGATRDAPPQLPPDLVLHWTEAAYDRPVRVADTS